MKVSELIARLQEVPQDHEVVIPYDNQNEYMVTVDRVASDIFMDEEGRKEYPPDESRSQWMTPEEMREQDEEWAELLPTLMPIVRLVSNGH